MLQSSNMISLELQFMEHGTALINKDAQGKGGKRGRINREIRIDTHTLLILSVKWGTNENLPNSTTTTTSLQSCPTLRPHRRQPTRLPRPWDSPGKNTGVGGHCLLQCMKVKSESEVAQSCPTLRDHMDCSPPGSSIHGISQARALEWGAIAFSAE